MKIFANIVTPVLTGLALLWSGLKEPVFAQAYSNFPYVSDFGTVGAPGADNALFKFVSDNGAGGWSIEAVPSGENYPTYAEYEDGTYSAFLTRPFQFTGGSTYRLQVVYETDAPFDDAGYYWRLAVKDPGNVFGTGYDVSFPSEGAPTPDTKLIMSETSGLPSGEFTPGAYEFTAPSTGEYALMFTVYPTTDVAFFPEGASRHIRIKSFEVTEKSSYDLAMGKIVTPVSRPGNAPQTVSAWVRNDGGVSVSDFTLCYMVGATTVVKQTFLQPLAPNAEVLVSFDEKAQLASGSNRIRVFLTDQRGGDPTANDTAAPVFVSIYDAYQVPATFNFGNNTLNQQWTVLYDEHTDRTTWQFGLQGDKNCAYISTNGTRNNARLASPGLHLSAGKTYRFRFHYTGLSGMTEKLAAYMTDADFLDVSHMAGYWKDEGFTNSLDRVATFFYTAPTDGDYHMVLKAYSNDLRGGIAVWDVDVSAYEPVHGDFYYEFDPMDADMTSAALLASSAYFIDENHNGQAWALVSTPVYNGESAIRAGEAFGSIADDWLVFNPVYLEKGKTYTLRYMLRSGGNQGAVLESMLCRESFAFGMASDTVRLGWNEVKNTTYEAIRYTFTPTESGNYQPAFRYSADLTPSSAHGKEELYSVYLDHIGLYEAEREDLELVYVDIPVGAQMGQREVYIKCGYRNFGPTIEAENLKFYYSVGTQMVSESALRRVASGGIGLHNFNTPADFSRDTLNEVRVWAQDGDKVITDTFKVTIRSLKSHYLPYRDLLTDETKDEWRISSLSANPSWRFVTDETYDAPYAARTAASDGVLDDYLVMPAMQLQKDTVYMVAFYAKSSQERTDWTQTGLSLVYSEKGYSVIDFDRQIGRLDTLTTDYRLYRLYFKAQQTGPVFIAFHSQLPAYSGYNWIDHVVVMDSVAASYSYMALTDVSYRRVTGCDEDRTTEVEVEIRNNGYLAYDSVPLLYKMDNLPVQTCWPEGGAADMSTLWYKLPTRWDLSVAGNHRMRVWLGMSNEADRSNDTLTVTFRADDMAQLPLGYDFENNVLPGNVEDRNEDRISWELHRNADSAYQGRYYVRYVGTGQASDDDWRLPCFYADAGDYTLDFYLSAPYGSEELLEVYLLHYDETDTNGMMIQELLLDTVVTHQDYRFYQLPFGVSAGHYGAMFRIKSEADGRTLCVDNLTIAGYGLKDVALMSILSPEEADTYDDPLDVTVRLRNNGRVVIHDVPVVLTVNGTEVQRAEVPTMEGNTEMTYTFPEKLDLHEPGTYRITIAVDWVLDQRPGNNRQEITRIQGNELDLSLMVLTSPMAGLKPYGREETLEVRVENYGRMASGEVPITAVINQTKSLTGMLPRIEAGGSMVYTFGEAVDMSDSAWYEFLIYLSPSEPDNNPLNDTLYSRIDGRYTRDANEREMLSGGISVYPNPARSTLYVEIPEGFTRLELYSLPGMLYLTRGVRGATRFELPVADYPDGFYILKLTGVSGEKTVKWLKTR